jgi:orotidine-5'-phosphate decarboxylase
MAETTFGQRVSEAVAELGPLCAGIDPSRAVLAEWGRDDDADGALFLSLRVLESVTGVAAAIKPQVAFFERFGAAGFSALERLLAEAREAGVLAVADAKRGDIGNTNGGYAQAWLEDGSPLAADAVTVHPYLGVGAFAGAIDLARTCGRGVFVVVASSNEDGRSIQTARTAAGEAVEDHLLAEVAEINGAAPAPGVVGAVLGATRQRPEFDLAALGGPVLVPGVGAQGASPADVGRLTERCARSSVLANVARGILSAGPDQRGLHDAARRWRDDLASQVA